MREYVFCINPGRSGSAHLFKLFSYVNGCKATHEPTPILNGKVMRRFLKGHTKEMVDRMPEKVEQITAVKGDSPLYVETNHCFIKGFGWLIPNYIPQEKIAVIILKRPIKEVVNSTYKINSTPLAGGRNWIITPLKKDILVPLPIKLARLKQLVYRPIFKLFFNERLIKFLTRGKEKRIGFIKRYELAIIEWYVQELEAMGEEFRKRFPHILFIDYQTKELSDLSYFMKVVNTINPSLKIDKKIESVYNKKSNISPHLK